LICINERGRSIEMRSIRKSAPDAAASRPRFCQPFDPHQRPRPALRYIGLVIKEIAMPIDSILVSAAVVSVFVVFAGVLIWGNFQTEPAWQGPAKRNRKRRSV
jgi:hypothetical protein